VTIPRLPEEKDVQPVGHDYIEEMKSEDGKVVSFNCKLCECRFNDPNAKEMHMKVQCTVGPLIDTVSLVRY
jgi:hypothetical protein